MLLIDLEEGRIIEDEELKAGLSEAQPYAKWLDRTQYKLDQLEIVDPEFAELPQDENQETPTLLQAQQAFGYTQEDITKFLEPMARDGGDPIGSMGTDTPLAVLSNKSRLLYDLFQAELCASNQPANRSDPRRASDEPALYGWPAPKSARPRCWYA